MLNKIGKYELKEIIDKNEFGLCYKAIDDNNKLYAIKKINIQNKEFVNDEIKILKSMNSKYSVEFIELIEKNDYVYMIMELCDNNLNDLLNKNNGNLDLTIIIDIISQLNEALKMMNSKDIVHTNLKPENILIKNTNDIHIKLSNYKLTKNFQNNNNSYFQAPEVSLFNKRNIKSNLWNLGLILYYLYFNQLPFIDIDDYFNLNNKIILKKTHNEISDDLISKLLIKNSNERINWNDYFNHPFNKQQLIEIYIDIEKDKTNSTIINKEFNQEQLKDSKIFLNGKKINFKFDFIFKKGKHFFTIII